MSPIDPPVPDPAAAEFKALTRTLRVLTYDFNRALATRKSLPNDIDDLQETLQQLKDGYTKFGNCISEICQHCPTDDLIDKYQAELNNASEKFIVYKKELVEAINKIEEESAPSVVTEASTAPSTTSRALDIPLPPMALPEFHGDAAKFQHFLNKFEVTLQDQTISNQKRLQYLASCLKGKAAAVIQHLDIIGDNYDVALRLLKTKYENKRKVVFSQIERLLAISPAQSAHDIETVYDQINGIYHGLKSQDSPVENSSSLFIYTMLHKLDEETRSDYIKHMGKKLTTATDFLDFLQAKVETLDDPHLQRTQKPFPYKQSQPAPPQKPFNQYKPYNQRQPQPAPKPSTSGSSAPKCPACDKLHLANSCQQFNKLDINGRRNLIRSKGLCFNCMQPGHSVSQCTSHHCFKCNVKHHTLLHLNPTTAFCNESQEDDFMPTVMVPVLDVNGVTHKVRAVLDSGSTANLLSSKAVNQLQLPMKKSAYNLATLTDNKPVRRTVSITIAVPGEPFSIQAGVVETILPHNVPQVSLPDQLLHHLKNLHLADANFNSPLPVDLLLSAKVFFHLLNSARVDGPDGAPGARDTKLGYIITPSGFHTSPDSGSSRTSPNHGSKAGSSHHTTASMVTLTLPKPSVLASDHSYQPPTKTPNVNPSHPVAVLPTRAMPGSDRLTVPSEAIHSRVMSPDSPPSPAMEPLANQESLPSDKAFKQLWALENPPVATHLSQEENQCEEIFNSTTTRNPDGSFCVKLPMSDKPIADTRQLAYCRLQSLEKKFAKDPELHEAYSNQLQEYLDLDHMEAAPPTTKPTYFLPHHAVWKPGSTTTKMRIVFDGSASSGDRGVSLNAAMMNGPKQQEDLWQILTRFRRHVYGLTADISQMYRQIHLNNLQWDLHRVLWRANIQEPVQEFRLKRLTFGTKAAPFLATRVLRQLADDTEPTDPRSAEVVKNDFYMDDLMSGTDTVLEAMQLHTRLQAVLASGGFHLTKWASNCPAIRSDTSSWTSIKNTDFVSTLGLHWDPIEDVFRFTITEKPIEKCTKREILSRAAQLFDPLGWLSPTTIYAKMFLQTLWKLDLPWDQPLPQHLEAQWRTYTEQLSTLESVKIPRHVGSTTTATMTICGFADASEKAYAAAVYLRNLHPTGRISCHLVAAKTKVAPIKSTSIPRLELQAAHLLSKLVTEVKTALRCDDVPTLLFSDSSVTLAWVRAPSYTWQTFVGNRVAAIQSTTDTESWHYVRSADNPADCASRSITAAQLCTFKLWWHGPQFLHEEPIAIPAEPNLPTTVPELKISLMTTTANLDDLVSRYSDLVKSVKVTAWILRLAAKAKRSTPAHGPITAQEYDFALLRLVKLNQQYHYQKEIACLERNKPIPPSSSIRLLCPFLDKNGFLRITGRLQNANIPPDEKHQLILPGNSHLTKLLVRWYHQQNLHAAPTLLLSIIRTRFWIVGGKRTIKSIIRTCTTCHRQRAAALKTAMGNLPASRVTLARPFTEVGVDFAGPIITKPDLPRTQKRNKSYVAVFVCMATKAIHLEAVSSLSTDAFLAAFKRFTARRGTPSTVHSDNATNFVGADHALQDFLASLSTELPAHLVPQKITWKFIPPRAPNFGGLWEAGVKSVKYHLHRAASSAVFTFEELTTILQAIEACLNSRPLCPLSDDPEDLAPLTPGHFLIGTSLKAPPQLNLEQEKLNHLDRWQLATRTTQEFWRRWHREYLNRLQNRPKEAKPSQPLRTNQLVLIIEDNLPPQSWRLGRIVQLHPGHDGITRVVTLKTATGTCKRAVSKISPLPVDEPVATAIPKTATVPTAKPDVVPVAPTTPDVSPSQAVTKFQKKDGSKARSPSQAVSMYHKKDGSIANADVQSKDSQAVPPGSQAATIHPRRSQRQRRPPAFLNM